MHTYKWMFSIFSMYVSVYVHVCICGNVHVCIYIYIYIYIYVCVCVCMYVYTHTHTHIYIYIYIYVYIYIYIYIYMCVCVCVGIYMCVCVYIYVCVYVCIYICVCVRHRSRGGAERGLYKILLLPILYGAWHTHWRSEGGRILPNSRATVLHQGRQCRWARGIKAWLNRAQQLRSSRSERISC